MRGGVGVVGVSLNSIENPLQTFEEGVPDPADGSGVGVLGTSGTGVGVRGTAEDGIGGEFISSAASGVSGDSGSGVGVEGRSTTGVGLHGVSSEDRAAVFESGENVAQMRLVPQMQRTRDAKLPKKGKVGDLILIRYRGGIRIQDASPTDVCSLWLCVPTATRARGQSSDDSNLWQEVILGQVVTGTI